MEDTTKSDVSVSAKFKSFIEEIEKMSVIELNELVKTIETKFGVTAQASVVAGPVAGAGEAKEEKSTYDLHLTSGGETKIQVIKAIKEALNLGLKEAKDIVDGAPKMVKEGMKKEDAEALKAKIDAAGGKAELK